MKRIFSMVAALALTASLCLGALPAAAEGTPAGEPETPACICTDLCTEDAVNADCPVCAQDATRCTGKAAETPDEPKEPQAPAARTTLTANNGIALYGVNEITEAGGELAAGTYTLERDIVLEQPLVIPADAAVTIKLNGHALTAAGEVINVETGKKATDDIPQTTYGSLTVEGPGALTSTGSGSVITVNVKAGSAANGSTEKGALKMTGDITVTGNGGSGSVIYANNSDVTLTGNIVVSGGTGTNYQNAYYGGGIFVVSDKTATVELDGVTVRDNHLATGGIASHGGGMTVFGCGIGIKNCVFESNSAENGGGGMALISAFGPVENCVISNNTAALGGGLEITVTGQTGPTDRTCTLKGCTIQGNTASYFGGGLIFQFMHCVVDGGIITGNEVTGKASDTPDTLQQQGIFYGTGGGIYSIAVPFTLQNGGIIARNTAATGGADVCYLYVTGASGILTLPNPATFGIDGLDKWYDDNPDDRFDEESQGRESVTDVTATTYLVAAQVNTVTFDSNGGSAVASQTVKEGEKAVKPANPTRSNYTFEGWFTDETLKNAYDFNTPVTGDITLYADWDRRSSGGGGGGGSTSTKKYTITVICGKGGEITPDGGSDNEVEVPKGNDQTFRISADNGYRISDVLVDGESVGSVDKYTFKDVDEDHEIEAIFARRAADPSDSGTDRYLNTEDHVQYMTGYPDGTFGPSQNMTRAEAAQMFYALLLDKNVAHTVSFSDVPADAWYAEAVNTLASLGMINGYPDGTFRPDAPITRAEFCVIALAFAYEPEDFDCDFRDVSTRDWFYDYVAQATSYGWISGSDRSFRPNECITRAEVSVIVNNMLGRVADEDYIDRHEDELNTFPDVKPSHWAYYSIMETANSHDFTKRNGNENWR